MVQCPAALKRALYRWLLCQPFPCSQSPGTWTWQTVHIQVQHGTENSRIPVEQGRYFNSQFLCDCFLISVPTQKKHLSRPWAINAQDPCKNAPHIQENVCQMLNTYVSTFQNWATQTHPQVPSWINSKKFCSKYRLSLTGTSLPGISILLATLCTMQQSSLC